jgi:lipoprotein-anchoring transpeptidase ErfK/SrfK
VALCAVTAALAIPAVVLATIGGPKTPQEGGTGHTAPAAVAAAVRNPPAHTAAARSRVPAPVLIATLRTATSYRTRPAGPVAGTLPARNPFGGADVLAVVGEPTANGWIRVELPVRPNGSRAWIPLADVTLAQTSFHVTVNLEARTISVTDGGRPVLTAPAAVGSPSTPTPAGQTFLWELVRPDDPTGAYGPYIFGLGWFSDAYALFNGGDAQIAIHGQDDPGSLGHAVSHGCVRVANDLISRLARTLPLGTPVTIV